MLMQINSHKKINKIQHNLKNNNLLNNNKNNNRPSLNKKPSKLKRLLLYKYSLNKKYKRIN